VRFQQQDEKLHHTTVVLNVSSLPKGCVWHMAWWARDGTAKDKWPKIWHMLCRKWLIYFYTWYDIGLARNGFQTIYSGPLLNKVCDNYEQQNQMSIISFSKHLSSTNQKF